MHKVTPGEILRIVGSKTFARGDTYHKEGHVNTLKVEQKNKKFLELHSSVRGNGNRIYSQRIIIDWTYGYTRIAGDCSCPVEYNCKHITAVCLQFAASDAPEENSKDTCLNWLNTFCDTASKKEDLDTSRDFIAYILKPSKQMGKLEVTLCLTRQLKKGGMSKGRVIKLDTIFNSYYTPAYLQKSDEYICNLLQANSTQFTKNTLLYNELGFLALNKILQTGRCYWLETGQALAVGAERLLKPKWQLSSEEGAKLSLEVEPEATLLLTDPPLYLDSELKLIGSLKGATYSFHQLEQLLNAPVVPPEALDSFSRQLAKKLSSDFLPPPKKVDIEEIHDQAPQPALHLSAIETPNGYLHSMRVRFFYNGHEVSYSFDNETVYSYTEKDKIIRIQRDLDKEDEAARHIENLGFEGRINTETKDLIFFHTDHQNPAEGAMHWYNFIHETIPTLEQKGWRVEIDPGFNIIFHDAKPWNIEIEEHANDWFDLHFDVEINNQPLPLLPLIAQVLDNHPTNQLPETLTLHLGNDQYLNIASEQLKPIIDTLYELYDKKSLQNNGSLRMSRFDAGRLSELEQEGKKNLHWRNGEALRQLGQQLREFKGITPVPPPQGLQITLRDYQQQGLNWLQFLREYSFSGILADDMGLGKTVQTLAHLLLEKEQGRMDKPCLIIAPTSLMSNWRREAEQFTPSLKVLVLQGPDRHLNFENISKHDLILSTYPLLARDEEELLAQDYHFLVLDEAQMVKNPKAVAAQIIRKIKTKHRLCLTGTPMENHLGELWALFDFLMPGFLGDLRQFNVLFRTPIEKHGDEHKRQQLAQRVAPFMLRRRKADVAKELPEKTEIIRSISLNKKQAALYESIRISMEHKVQQAIANQGLSRSHITILDALLKLRQACCDPRLLALSQARAVNESAKLDLLMQLLPEMVEEGRKILLFSQFTKMLAHIETELKQHHIPYSKLTGQTRNRDAAIERFKTGNAAVFLISLKAGGVGLNLTEADTVIHYDPWWNPAAENQATDRAHRIGQGKAVFVYKLIVENSVEEKIIAMQHKKQMLTQSIYNKSQSTQDIKLNVEDLQQLFAPMQ